MQRVDWCMMSVGKVNMVAFQFLPHVRFSRLRSARCSRWRPWTRRRSAMRRRRPSHEPLQTWSFCGINGRELREISLCCKGPQGEEPLWACQACAPLLAFLSRRKSRRIRKPSSTRAVFVWRDLAKSYLRWQIGRLGLVAPLALAQIDGFTERIVCICRIVWLWTISCVAKACVVAWVLAGRDPGQHARLATMVRCTCTACGLSGDLWSLAAATLCSLSRTCGTTEVLP